MLTISTAFSREVRRNANRNSCVTEHYDTRWNRCLSFFLHRLVLWVPLIVIHSFIRLYVELLSPNLSVAIQCAKRVVRDPNGISAW